MPTSAAGSSGIASRAPWLRRGPRRPTAARGFTLLEMLVALMVIGIVTALAALALPPSQNAQVEREAQRLAALFDAARQRAAEQGVPLAWVAGPRGYAFVQRTQQGWEPVESDLLRTRSWPWSGGGLADSPDWITAIGGFPRSAAFSVNGVGVDLRRGGSTGTAAPPTWLVFGGEPVGNPVRLQLTDGDRSETISSDGFAPFAVERGGS